MQAGITNVAGTSEPLAFGPEVLRVAERVPVLPTPPRIASAVALDFDNADLLAGEGDTIT